jgi:hypothetical protein
MVSTCLADHPKVGTGAGDGVEAGFDTAYETSSCGFSAALHKHEKAAFDSPDQGKLVAYRQRRLTRALKSALPNDGLMQKRQQRRRHSHEWDAGTSRSGVVIIGNK